MKETDIVIDIEKCKVNRIEEFRSPDVELGNSEKSRNVDALSPNSVDRIKKEKRAKKSPKPPRPPRGLSLDAADQKLMKEISELLMIKRARIERIKALRKAKAASKASPSSSGNLVAMFFTVFFCIVIVFQGCQSWGIWRGHASAVGIATSPKANTDDASSVRMLPQAGRATY